ncbi:DNA (cytosine-5-)-methyltransferase [Nonomuraea dietziae]|uniref:DNA (cytosine-5-)-methyltransferase n=1 Tax=Nonomuraea dietziae TaxID=65515 RepID=UPI0033F2355B
MTEGVVDTPSETDSGRQPADVIGLSRQAVVDRIDELLELRYRSASLGNKEDPLAEAVYILLSVQTRESGYQQVFESIRQRYPQWADLAGAPRHELEALLKPTGFQQRRAQIIQDFLAGVAAANELRGNPQAFSLDYLRELSDEAVLQELLSLPGLGPKTARCIMVYTLGRRVFAVDTHVRRIFHRLGLVPFGSGKVDHEPYERIVPPEARLRLHVNLIHHGRAVCTSQQPKCSECPLISFCPEGHANLPAGKKPVAVELFAGAGGLGLGFEQAGFQVAVAVETERNAAQTYRANHPGTVVLERDVSDLKASDIRAVAPWLKNVDAVIGGPPCQGYSVAGKRDPNDQKNQLFLHHVRLASELDARFVVIENVLGMRNIKGVSFTEAVEDKLREVGYHTKHEKVRASDYGVPQLRYRIIFTAQKVRSGNAPEIPGGEYCGSSQEGPCRCGRPRTPTVMEVLDRPGLPRLPHGEDAEYLPLTGGGILLNGSTMKHSQKVINKIAAIEAGKGPISYRRLHQSLARTIVAGHRALPVHPVLHRTISVREAARIQGFPDDYVFSGTRGKQPLQVANAVPPALGKAVAAALVLAMKDKGKRPRHEYVDQCGPLPVRLLPLPQSDVHQLDAAAG